MENWQKRHEINECGVSWMVWLHDSLDVDAFIIELKPYMFFDSYQTNDYSHYG